MSIVEADLFPRPRRVSWTDEVAARDVPVTVQRDPALPPQGYRLVVEPTGIRLTHRDNAGLRYGRSTLNQLRAPRTGRWLRCGEIIDHPDVTTRGFMLDISRDRVPTRETLELLVGRLADLRYNHLQLYTEHTFAYEGHDPVWRDASPLTHDDMRWLDGVCADHGIELAANQNTFGHMERWLAHEPYRSRAETPDGWVQDGVRRAPTALAPTPENAAFAVELVRELTSTVRSDRVNIGCDEVWELGKGASADAVAARGKDAVFVEHLRRIAEPLLADGLDVMFWADMVQRAPDAAAPLADAGAIAAIWGYEAPMSEDELEAIDFDAMPEDIREAAERYLLGTARGFGPRVESFAETGFRTWVVPGTSGWNSFVGRWANARANLADAAAAAASSGTVEGLLVTEWGDNGHQQPPFATLPAVAYGGAVAWCHDTNADLTDDEVAAAIDRLLGDGAGRTGRAMVRLGGVADALGLGQPNGTQFFYAIVDSGLPIPVEAPSAAGHRGALELLNAAVADLTAVAPGVDDGELLVRELRQAAALTRHGLHRLARRAELHDAPSTTELATAFGDLVAEQRSCWLARSRPGGLEDSLTRLRPPGT